MDAVKEELQLPLSLHCRHALFHGFKQPRMIIHVISMRVFVEINKNIQRSPPDEVAPHLTSPKLQIAIFSWRDLAIKTGVRLRVTLRSRVLVPGVLCLMLQLELGVDIDMGAWDD
jgi:hypothetical protein